MRSTIFFKLPVLLFFTFIFLSCSKDEEVNSTPEPVIIPEAVFDLSPALLPDAEVELVGNPVIDGNTIILNSIDADNGCGKAGGQYIKLPAMDAIWEEGFTVAALTKFEDLRNYERIIDLGNGRGESNGYNITFSRMEETDDLAITSWIDSHPTKNRAIGRLIAKNAIRNNEMALYAATISPTGTMKIFVNGVKVAEKDNGYPVYNVARTLNYVGHSNWCDEDPDLKGVVSGIKIFNKELSDAQVAALEL